ncbi:glycerophosphoryl diester phosphodiesterase [Rhodopseudomonas julia]|uniref:Glycerophosphoryl diester phosphodiesterase n=1 Tax=Rhodopseudomonas julia TaxID=200617 RepID=A0ABU0CAR2_9BRAD|nr:glycerophosphodiester phosphodiesterase family protein [Rhodopseudomonas julia]MDQ0327263.1 glycerophosphoryl diester phosphodiesterase [Rhodopseudomonas julia]
MSRFGPLSFIASHPLAHRGLHDVSKGRPENSLAAFEAAIAHGYGIECDAHPSADGVAMVFHDDELARLTGAEGAFRDRNAKDLVPLRLSGTQETIPRLSDLLTLVAGRVPIVLELKSIPSRDAGFAEVIGEAIADYDGPLAVMSFDPFLLHDMQRVTRARPLGLTLEGNVTACHCHIAAIQRLELDFASCRVADLSHFAPLFRHAAPNKPLICWTVRNQRQRETAERWSDQITFEGFLA